MRASGVRRALTVSAVGAVLAVEVALVAFAGASPGPGAPPPTPVGPNGSLSPFVTRLRTPTDHRDPPAIPSAAAILADLDTGQVLLAHDPDRRLPIASVTKIMTALVVMRATEPGDLATVSARAAEPEGSEGLSELGLREGERISVGDLTWGLLVQSANDAAIALAEHVSGSVERFVARMNVTARRLGMRDTRFRSPNGLDDRGFSSARDLVTLTRAAFAEDPRFAAIVGSRFHDLPAPGGRTRHIQNRNVLLWLYPGATGVKTGYTAAAGFCVVATAERDGRSLIAVVLGAHGEPFSEAASLLDYGFDGFAVRRLVAEGEPHGTVEVRGGTVSVATGSGLSSLVPVAASGSIRRTVVVDPAAAFPPPVGERVATLRVSLGTRVLGSVPLLVSEVPPPPPVSPEPWWRRAAGALAHAAAGLVRGLL